MSEVISPTKDDAVPVFCTEVNPVRFQDGGSGGTAAPLFLVHDGSGLAYCYGRLAPLGRAVWGVHNPKFGTGEGWGGGLLEMAVHYAGLVKSKLVPGQPCVVGGTRISWVVH